MRQEEERLSATRALSSISYDEISMSSVRGWNEHLHISGGKSGIEEPRRHCPECAGRRPHRISGVDADQLGVYLARKFFMRSACRPWCLSLNTMRNHNGCARDHETIYFCFPVLLPDFDPKRHNSLSPVHVEHCRICIDDR